MQFIRSVLVRGLINRFQLSSEDRPQGGGAFGAAAFGGGRRLRRRRTALRAADWAWLCGGLAASVVKSPDTSQVTYWMASYLEIHILFLSASRSKYFPSGLLDGRPLGK